jgi:hypothetical protein
MINCILPLIHAECRTPRSLSSNWIDATRYGLPVAKGSPRPTASLRKILERDLLSGAHPSTWGRNEGASDTTSELENAGAAPLAELGPPPLREAALAEGTAALASADCQPASGQHELARIEEWPETYNDAMLKHAEQLCAECASAMASQNGN